MISKLKVFVAVMAVFALVITGTLALQQSIKYRNEILGNKGDPEITLHDDFDPGANKKDVYVENTGEVSFYVRVKLDEVMSLVSSDIIGDNDTGWIAHIYGDAAIDCGHANLADKLFHDYFAWTMGGKKYYMPADLAVGAVWPDGKEGYVIQDKNNYTGTEPGVKETPDAKIITVEAFLAMSAEAQKSFQGWIYDTDGYAYWSQVLRPGDVTGLLLHGVKGAQILKDLDFYYAINVIVEAVDIDDIAMWTKGDESTSKPGVFYDEATDDGKEVIYIIVGNAHNKEVADEKCCDECTDDVTCDCGHATCPGDGNGTGNNELAVKAPSDPVLGYTPRAGDGGWFTGVDWDLPGSGTVELDRAGAFRLEDILVNDDYENLTVTPIDSAKFNGHFTIDSFKGNQSIIFTYIPEKEEGLALYYAGGGKLPLTTTLLLEQNGKTATITVTLLYDSAFFSLPPAP